MLMTLPSDLPSEEPASFIEDVANNTSFVLGLSLGLVGAFMLSAAIWCHVQKVEGKKR